MSLRTSKTSSVHEVNNKIFKFDQSNGKYFEHYAARTPVHHGVCVLSSPTSDLLCMNLCLSTCNSVA